MYQAITVFDLDSTLLNAAKVIPPENLAALTALRANHVLPVIATGRDRFEIQDVIAAGQFDSIVSANGADVYAQGQQLLERTIQPATLERLIDWAANYQLSLAVSNHAGIGLNHPDELVRTNYHRIYRDIPPLDPDYGQTRLISKALIFLADHGRGSQLEAELRTQFSELTFYRNSDVCIDIVPQHTTKASGIQALRQQSALSDCPIYAFGDGHNDVSMLQAATVGVAMGNALVDVQQQADYVTTPYDQGGIVAALRHFNLIA